MKFLLDENIPPSVVRCIEAIGHDARHVNTVGLNSTADFDIFLFAEDADEVIITHDNDFSAIHAFSGKSKPSVVLLRHKKLSVAIICDLLTSLLPQIISDLDEGAFASVDEHSVRLRRLPIRK